LTKKTKNISCFPNFFSSVLVPFLYGFSQLFHNFCSIIQERIERNAGIHCEGKSFWHIARHSWRLNHRCMTVALIPPLFLLLLAFDSCLPRRVAVLRFANLATADCKKPRRYANGRARIYGATKRAFLM